MNNNFEELLQPLDEAGKEVYIQELMALRYTREQAINILNGLNYDGSEPEEELPF